MVFAGRRAETVATAELPFKLIVAQYALVGQSHCPIFK